MLYMNSYEIEECCSRFGRGDTPNLEAAAETLLRLQRWTNQNSDGWAYWKKPVVAARRLQLTLQAADRFDPVDISDAQLKNILIPIKSFLTRQGVDHSEVIR